MIVLLSDLSDVAAPSTLPSSSPGVCLGVCSGLTSPTPTGLSQLTVNDSDDSDYSLPPVRWLRNQRERASIAAAKLRSSKIRGSARLEKKSLRDYIKKAEKDKKISLTGVAYEQLDFAIAGLIRNVSSKQTVDLEFCAKAGLIEEADIIKSILMKLVNKHVQLLLNPQEALTDSCLGEDGEDDIY